MLMTYKLQLKNLRPSTKCAGAVQIKALQRLEIGCRNFLVMSHLRQIEMSPFCTLYKKGGRNGGHSKDEQQRNRPAQSDSRSIRKKA